MVLWWGCCSAYSADMKFTPSLLRTLNGAFRHLKTPLINAPAAQRDPAVTATGSAMVVDIQRGGIDAVLECARQLDNQQGSELELSSARIASSGSRLPHDLREAIELGSERTSLFAT